MTYRQEARRSKGLEIAGEEYKTASAHEGAAVCSYSGANRVANEVEGEDFALHGERLDEHVEALLAG